MLKALFKKEWLAILSFFTQGKLGKKRSNATVIGFVLLMVYGFGASAVMFWMLAYALCEPLTQAGLNWVYFAFMSVITMGIGVILGIFIAKSKLYEAKDNELLLSMPIPTWMILLVRMIELYLFILLFQALVFLPTLIKYFVVAGVTVPSVLFGLVLLFVMPLGSLAICCLVGFLLSWILSKVPYKNLFTVVLLVAFMVGYSLLTSKINEYLTYVITHGEAVGETMNTVLYPFAQIGKALTGDLAAFGICLLIFLGVFGAVYCLLALTYLPMVTIKRGEKKAVYKEKKAHGSSVQAALFKREFLRLIKSPAYLLNSSMGTLMVTIIGVMILIYGDFFGVTKEMLAQMGDAVPLLVSLIVCFLCASNFIAACALSLEGESLWIVQSLPVDSWEILKAKMYLHYAATALPSALCGVAMGIVAGLSWDGYVMMVLAAMISTAMFAALDLTVNLKFPNLHWTNETAAVKQSMSTLVAMLGGWGIALLPLGGYFLFGKYLPAWGYAAIILALFVGTFIFLWLWLKKRGTRIFESLS